MYVKNVIPLDLHALGELEIQVVLLVERVLEVEWRLINAQSLFGQTGGLTIAVSIGSSGEVL